MNFLRTLFGRKQTKKSASHSDAALRNEPVGKYGDIAKTIVDGWSATSGTAEHDSGVKRFLKLLEEGNEDAAYAALEEANAKASSPGLVPGDVVVLLTDAKTAALGLGGLFQRAKEEHTAFLDVMVLMHPVTGKSDLYAKGEDGVARSLDGFMADQHKSYVLRIARENVEHLKRNRQIWGRVKNVIGD